MNTFRQSTSTHHASEQEVQYPSIDEDIERLKGHVFYISAPHTCSYLPHLTAQMMFVAPDQLLDINDTSALSRLGFRRSGQVHYRPRCQRCRACIPSRIDVEKFAYNRTQKRLLKNNTHFQVTQTPTTAATTEHFELFKQYINTRHADGDMRNPTEDTFREFVIESDSQYACSADSATNNRSFLLNIYDQNRLIACALCDQFNDGISAVYTFYHPDYTTHSLGTWLILKQIEHCQNDHLPYLYLGYYIATCDKMNYKGRFKALELFDGSAWRPHLTS